MSDDRISPEVQETHKSFPWDQKLPKESKKSLRRTVVNLAGHLRYETQLKWDAMNELARLREEVEALRGNRVLFPGGVDDQPEALERIYAIDKAVKELRARTRRDDFFCWSNGDILDVRIPPHVSREVDELIGNIVYLVRQVMHEDWDSTVRWNGEPVTTNAAGESFSPSMGGN